MEPLVYIYADESCLGNQYTDRASPGGAGGMLASWREDAWLRRDYWVSEPATTNNRMAIRSAIEGLGALRRPSRVIFVSDSQYLVKGMSEWIGGWVARSWRRRSGEVENADLWRRLLIAAHPHGVDWRWVRGHAGHPENEYANELATRAAKERSSSGGPVESGFTEWLERRREAGQYLDYHEFAAPGEEEFRPVPVPEPGD